MQDNTQKNYQGLKVYGDRKKLVQQISHHRDLAKDKDPSIIIIGASGRCGNGAAQLLDEVGINSRTYWDRDETEKGGPFKEIVEHNIFINTVLVTEKIPPFIDRFTLNNNKELKVIADVSCDPTSDLNPIPLYHSITNWERPFFVDRHTGIEILAVDNLPSVLPKESSEDFSSQLLPLLLSLKDSGVPMKETPIWKNAYKTYQDTMKGYFN